MTSNRLHQQTSPYLLQHVDNPVHWQPWDDQALQLALSSNQPILLSIGYSACHWCHVMAHESFEDGETAAIMNAHFVNIKIDREERPDLDQIYQLAHQMLTQRAGGWPLTMFLTPDQHIPFFGGTYFPSQATHGLPAFRDLLINVSNFYEQQQEKIVEQSEAILQVFRNSAPAAATEFELNAMPIEAATKALIAEFDAQHGGFGGAPKFPQTPSLERLLRHWRRTAFDREPDLQSLYVVSHSLTAMAQGGLLDQLGGGFYRYTVDHNWRIPHFEKMLYDNAQLLALYSEIWRATGDGVYGECAHHCADWLVREMKAQDGGFFTALDADSEGHEGKFYVWDRKEIERLLEPAEWHFIAPYFGLDEAPNFEGQWHLYQATPLETIDVPRTDDAVADRADSGTITGNNNMLLARARTKLFAHREKRIRPFCDTKRLCSSNSLLLRSFALAGRHLGREDFVDEAQQILHFIQTKLWQNQRLYTSYNDGRAELRGYLTDYAYLIDGILELLQIKWNSHHFAFCQQLADILLDQFYDPVDGGFFFTAEEHEDLLHRMKPLTDDASPSGNGIAVRVLNRLGHILAETRYLSAAQHSLRLAWPALERVPHAHCSLLDGLDEVVNPLHIVIIRGQEEVIAEWLPIALETYAPHIITLAIPHHCDDLPAALSIRQSEKSGVAYICQGTQCSAPVRSAQELNRAIKQLK